MAKAKKKHYAITLTVKPERVGISYYKSMTFRGIVYAENPTKAKETAINTTIQSFDPNNGPIVTREVIFIKHCKVHGDFAAESK